MLTLNVINAKIWVDHLTSVENIFNQHFIVTKVAYYGPNLRWERMESR
jgi:hypothetical protein